MCIRDRRSPQLVGGAPKRQHEPHVESCLYVTSWLRQLVFGWQLVFICHFLHLLQWFGSSIVASSFQLLVPYSTLEILLVQAVWCRRRLGVLSRHSRLAQHQSHHQEVQPVYGICVLSFAGTQWNFLCVVQLFFQCVVVATRAHSTDQETVGNHQPPDQDESRIPCNKVKLCGS